MEWPLQTVANDGIAFGPYRAEPYVPPVAVICDLLEFGHSHVARPIQRGFHEFFCHHHLTFDRPAGQEDFRSQVNRILARNGLAYELRYDGTVQRLAPPALREALTSAVFRTGDITLDNLPEQARTRFLSPNPDIRRESLEKLRDAWERLKTIDNSDKKLGIAALLDKASPDATFRELLNNDPQDLTDIGNIFQIRHTETKTVPIQGGAQVDYLFHRLFSMVLLLLSKR